jgi:predicted Na+-dependent transporter
MNRSLDILAYLGRLRSVLLVLLAVVAGLLVPAAAPFFRELTPFIVAFLVYSSLVGIRFDRRVLLHALLPVTLVLVLSYAIIPIVGVSVGALYLSDGMLLGVGAALSAPATAGSAIVWTRLANGNEDLSAFATIFSLGLAPFVTPYLFHRLTSNTGAIPLQGMSTTLLLIMAAAGALLLLRPDGVGNESALHYLTVLAIGLLIYAGVGTTGLVDPMLVVGSVGPVAIAVLVTGLTYGALVVRVIDGSPGDLVAIVFSGSLKNLGIALLLVLATSSRPALSAVIGYYVSQQILSALVIDGFSAAIPGLDVILPAREG